MNLGVVGQAIGLFAVTNVDDILILTLFFGQAASDRAAEARIVIGQYVGFFGILAASIVGALGAGLLPESALPYLGMLPLLLGVRAGWSVFRDRHKRAPDQSDDQTRRGGPTVVQVAAVTFANGGDNIGVYVPVFAVTSAAGVAVYAIVFLAGVGVWCLAGRFLATRPIIARALTRWGHVLLPIVLIAIGLLIMVEGGAFGLSSRSHPRDAHPLECDSPI